MCSDRAIPSSNIDLHYFHCSRNLEKCKLCDEMVPKKHAEEHYSNTHAPVCSQSFSQVIIYILALKKINKWKRNKSWEDTHTHTQVSCSLCSESMEPESLAAHQREHCPKRIVTCDYCEFPLPAIDLFEHQVTNNQSFFPKYLKYQLIISFKNTNYQEVCGNRTELCNLCIRYIRLRERMAHELTCNGVPDTTVEASRFKKLFTFFFQQKNILHYIFKKF